MNIEFFQKNYIVNDYLLKVKNELNMSLNEFIILMFLINDDEKKLDVDYLAQKLYLTSEEVLNTINSLVEKKIIALNSKKDGQGKMADYISLDGLLEIIKKSQSKEIKKKEKLDIYGFFEKEFGRTISSMEYEIINAWIEKDFSEEMILAALKEAVYNGVANLRYIDKILYEWKKKGIKSQKDIDAYLKKRKDSSPNSNELFDYNWIDDEA